MVRVVMADKQRKTAKVELSLNDVYDIVTAVNIMVARSEDEITRYNGDDIEKQQLARYRTVLEGMQQAKEKILEG